MVVSDVGVGVNKEYHAQGINPIVVVPVAVVVTGGGGCSADIDN